MMYLYRSIQYIKCRGKTALLNTHANRKRPKYTFVVDVFPFTTKMATRACDNQFKNNG